MGASARLVTGTPDAELNPKKKIYPQIAPDCITDARGVACYKGTPFQVAVSWRRRRICSFHPQRTGSQARPHQDPQCSPLLSLPPHHHIHTTALHTQGKGHFTSSMPNTLIS